MTHQNTLLTQTQMCPKGFDDEHFKTVSYVAVVPIKILKRCIVYNNPFVSWLNRSMNLNVTFEIGIIATLST